MDDTKSKIGCETLVRIEKDGTKVMKPKKKFDSLDEAIYGCKQLNVQEHRISKVGDEDILKGRVAQFFKLKPAEVVTYDELITTPKGDVPRLHVIVTPNDGDDAAFRHDVKSILLTQH